MISIRAFLLVGAVVLPLGCASAQAADLFGKRSGGSTKDFGFRPSVGSDAGWYARLDGGFAMHSDPSMVEGGTNLSDESYDSTWSVGVGFGRYFTSKLRGDLTYDYRFSSDVTAANNSGGVGSGGRNLELAQHLLLANLYYDFIRNGRFSPYLGVGLGVVNHSVDGGSNAASGVAVASSDDWQFAAALMAGVTLKFGGDHVIRGSVKDGSMHMARSQQIKLDLGYRYLYLGEAETGRVSTAANGVIASGISIDDIHAHEFRFGLRYDLR